MRASPPMAFWPVWLQSPVRAIGSPRPAPFFWEQLLAWSWFSVSNCWSGCVLMTPSVRFPYTACVVSGERCHWGYSRLGSMELPGLFLPTTLPRYGAVATFAVAMAVMLAVNATGTLRLSEEGEL